MDNFAADGVHLSTDGYAELQKIITDIMKKPKTALLMSSPDRYETQEMEELLVEFMGGNTAQYWAENLDTIADTLQTVTNFIIMLGDNDLDAPGADNIPPSDVPRTPFDIFRDIQSIVDGALRINPQLRVYVLTVIPRPQAYGTDYEEKRRELNQMLYDYLLRATLVDTNR